MLRGWGAEGSLFLRTDMYGVIAVIREFPGLSNPMSQAIFEKEPPMAIVARGGAEMSPDSRSVPLHAILLSSHPK